ncbi:MAG TPA: DUF1223 domain-containing protein [Thermoanaerobaculia bacterium]|jgi:hypothetical protein|nr:DUF1223 domain-containing protein [Thermoanaerobaculia bacterium]
MTPALLFAVVVELFTSQGCSSCPPADALLRELRRDPNVIAIAYHVDYWDNLGWRDPFSAKEWTQRQMEYVRTLKLPSAYTPQIVVDGTRQMVGSNAVAVRTAIGAAQREERNAPSMRLTSENGSAVVVTNAPRAGLQLLVLALSNEQTTKIERGENAGLTLANADIARKLVRIQNVVAGPHTYRVPSLAGEKLVAILQDPATLQIVSATTSGRN